LAREFGQRPSARAFPHERPLASIRGSPLPPRTTRRERPYPPNRAYRTQTPGRQAPESCLFFAPWRLRVRFCPGPGFERFGARRECEKQGRNGIGFL
jgi:hypothetical protein